ncbi:MAG: phosphomannose isomerase type II C-terminal cupin domain [Cyanobium sp.]
MSATPASASTERPWGWFETLAQGEGYLVKRLLIRAGRRISLQRHRHRCEHWVVVGGEGELELEGRAVPAGIGTTLFVPVGAWHRAAAGSHDLLIIEVQRGADLREDDIERSADDFGRVPG